ncbi:hypothetical protein ACODT5_15455 [Streptomyces sp. 5.8]|uniref:hypothetical protein n=1 Tax=Streptomyces sp. 5.8 TaxID=3406571 RepID=UPI003BB74A3B
MSARITVRCDRMGQYGSCPAQLLTDTADEAEANRTAARLGWGITGTSHHCPRHSAPSASRSSINTRIPT